VIKHLLWIICSALFFTNPLSLSNGFKKILLRCFGTKMGQGVVIKPSVQIKYPWKLRIGSHSWIGENVWIDNLEEVVIGDNVCISQGAFLLTGNHNYKSTSFDLIMKAIELEDGVWIGAKATVCPGVSCKELSVLTVGSVAASDLEASGVYQGNPAKLIRTRKLDDNFQN
jgi:putative colanic acid biosynthesis acetyltransferase WcaF